MGFYEMEIHVYSIIEKKRKQQPYFKKQNKCPEKLKEKA